MWMQVSLVIFILGATVTTVIRYWFSSATKWKELNKEWAKILSRVQSVETSIEAIHQRCNERAEVGQKVLEQLQEVGKVLSRLTQWLEGNEKRLDKIEAAVENKK